MLILGVDPGTAVTGFGVVRGDGRSRPTLVECGVLRTRPHEPLAARLRDLYDGLSELLDRHRPDAMAVEAVFYARNARTTIALGHARGVLLLAGVQRAVPIHEYPPAAVKKAVVGRGAATKDQVQYMVARLLRLEAPPQPADAADGVAAALACLMGAHVARLSANGASRP